VSVTRLDYQELSFCQNEKGLIIYGWCLMSNHLHLIVSVNGLASLSDILSDFKSSPHGKLQQPYRTTTMKVERIGCYGYSDLPVQRIAKTRTTSFGDRIIDQ